LIVVTRQPGLAASRIRLLRLRTLGLQQGLELGGAHRLADQVALQHVALGRADRAGLRLGLDAFADHR
jgi:hypothetical protein